MGYLCRGVWWGYLTFPLSSARGTRGCTGVALSSCSSHDRSARRCWPSLAFICFFFNTVGKQCRLCKKQLCSMLGPACFSQCVVLVWCWASSSVPSLPPAQSCSQLRTFSVPSSTVTTFSSCLPLPTRCELSRREWGLPGLCCSALFWMGLSSPSL